MKTHFRCSHMRISYYEFLKSHQNIDLGAKRRFFFLLFLLERIAQSQENLQLEVVCFAFCDNWHSDLLFLWLMHSNAFRTSPEPFCRLLLQPSRPPLRCASLRASPALFPTAERSRTRPQRREANYLQALPLKKKKKKKVHTHIHRCHHKYRLTPS